MRTVAGKNPKAAARRPTFFWQGALMVVPVAVLAVLGLMSLRQDKALARAAAAERAQELAEDLASKIWTDLVAGQISQLNKARWFEVDSAGRLVSPPPCDPTPQPCPLDLSDLTPEQARLWQAAKRGEASGSDPGETAEACRQLLASQPPAEVAAAAQYTLGLLLAKAGKAQAAAESFERVRTNFPEARGESGLPLRILAEVKLLEVLPLVEPSNRLARLPAVEALCSNAVHQPTALSGHLLGLMAERAVTPEEKAAVGKWLELWAANESERDLFAAAQADFSSAEVFWFRARGIAGAGASDPEWLAFREAGRFTNALIICRSEAEVGSRVRAVLAGMKQIPDYFGVGVELAGRRLAGFAPDLRLWENVYHMSKGGGHDEKQYSTEAATNALASATGGPGEAGRLRVHVYLTSPATLFAQQTTRTFWFGSLIASSALAALVGLLASARAFRRQLQLGEMKSNFVSSVSHELRAPIASVRLLAESLERGKVAEPAKQHEYFHFIGQECRRLSSLIENVLDFSRIDQGRKQYEFEPTDLEALTRQTVNLMQTYAEEREVTLKLDGPQMTQMNADEMETATVESELLPPGLQATVDGKAIQQALINLIDNALKHSPKGSEVRVGLKLSPHEQATDPLTEGERPGLTVLLWVEDDGPGIPSAEHQKIFERFYRRGSELRRETRGVGIGLSIVKHIVEAHGGRVRVESEVGRGSRFTLELPAALTPAETDDNR